MVTESEVEEFHRLGNIPHREITKHQAEKWKQLYEMVWGKRVALTESEIRKKIEQKPFDRNTVEECFPKISEVHMNDYGSFCSPDFSKYPNRIYRVDINSVTKYGMGIEIVHEFCHVLYEDGNCIENYAPTDYVIEEYAKATLEKDPELPNFILKRLKELGKLVV